MGKICCAFCCVFELCVFFAPNLLGMLPHGCQLVTSVNGGGGLVALPWLMVVKVFFDTIGHLFGFQIWLSDQKSRWYFLQRGDTTIEQDPHDYSTIYKVESIIIHPSIPANLSSLVFDGRNFCTRLKCMKAK